jgi:anthranilate phosphoribosyltransferase
MNPVVTPILAKLTRGTSLTPDEIDAALGELLEGRVADVQAAGFIVALRTKGETDEELAALVRAMHRYATHVDVPDGAIDTCGTGGDRSGTVNVSTMAALIAAGAGAKVVKHGNRAQSSQCGSADVLEALGVAIELGPEGVARCVREAGVGFCLAPRYHPAMRFLGPARKELGVPTTFNFLGPLANPARVRRQAVGVSDETMATRMLGTLAELGAERAMVFHGNDGLDEITTTTTSAVHELVDGERRTSTFEPLDFGIARTEPAQLAGGDALTNARAIHAVLAGEKGAFRDIALLNAAAALIVAGTAPDFGAALETAAASIDGGGAARALDALVRVSSDAKAAEAG